MEFISREEESPLKVGELIKFLQSVPPEFVVWDNDRDRPFVIGDIEIGADYVALERGEE